jgi:hypothetical protein
VNTEDSQTIITTWVVSNLPGVHRGTQTHVFRQISLVRTRNNLLCKRLCSVRRKGHEMSYRTYIQGILVQLNRNTGEAFWQRRRN